MSYTALLKRGAISVFSVRPNDALTGIAFVLCVTMLTGCISAPVPSTSIDLAIDDTVVHVPASGPLANQEATQIAKEAVDVDKLLENPDLLGVDVPAEVRTIALEMVSAFRDEAVDGLSQSYILAENTSGGLDEGLINVAKQSIDKATQIIAEIRESPPSRVNVQTEITSEPDAILEYVSVGRYRVNKGTWSTYNSGEIMRIGRYRFRAVASDNMDNDYDEIIHVLSDPTVRKIVVRQR